MVDHHPGFEVHGTATGRLPSSGRPMTDMRLERDCDYPADTDLVFGRGGGDFRIRLTGADMHGLRALLTAQDDLKACRARARALGLSGNGHGTALADSIENLAVTAHADGYRLCDEDYRATGSDLALLGDALADLLNDGGDRPPADVEALERVIAMLRSRA